MNVSAASLDFALLHAVHQGDSNLLPIPFEFQAAQHDWARLRPRLEALDLEQWAARPYRRVSAPKNRFGFRLVTQLDPLDFLLYTGVVHQVGADIERVRLPVASEVVFSNRFAPDATNGRLYDSTSDWQRFQQKCRDLAGNHSHIATSDIAEFFQRLYFHPLENALDNTLSDPGAARALKRFIKQLNQNVSYGIPIGPDASFLLAELVLDVVDRALSSEGITFCRWADDFRLFANSEREAYEALRKLNRALGEALGLSLNQTKTRVFEQDAFLQSTVPEQRQEVNRLSEDLYSILAEAGIEDPGYGEIDISQLDPPMRERIDQLNLVGILREQVEAEQVEQTLVRWVTYRLSQLADPGAVMLLLDNPVKFYPVFADVLKYIGSIGIADAALHSQVEQRLLELLRDSIVADSKQFRLWLLWLFQHNFTASENDLAEVFRTYTDEETRREIYLAMRHVNALAFVKTRKQEIAEMPRWRRRAFLVAARSLHGDESDHYYRSLTYMLDELERSVVAWIRATM